MIVLWGQRKGDTLWGGKQWRRSHIPIGAKRISLAYPSSYWDVGDIISMTGDLLRIVGMERLLDLRAYSIGVVPYRDSRIAVRFGDQ